MAGPAGWSGRGAKTVVWESDIQVGIVTVLLTYVSGVWMMEVHDSRL
jgi:hypothetical protein